MPIGLPASGSARQPRWLGAPPRPHERCAALPSITLMLAGCATKFEEKAPEQTATLDAWQVHCETAHSHRPSNESLNKGVDRSTWLVALDEDLTPHQLTGLLEDGFLRLGPTQPDEDELRAGCIRAVTQDDRDGGNEIARILAFRPTENVNVSIQYPRDAGDGLTRLLIFGESLSDTGVMKSRLRILPAAPYWIGRFSNGPAWPDYMNAMSHLAVRNFAVGGASVSGKATIPKTTISQRIQDGGQFFISGTTEQQINLFRDAFMTEPRLTRPEKTAFVIWGGANDYISKEPFSGAIETLLDRVEEPDGYPVVVARVITLLEEQLRTLEGLGATRILVGNLPDLGQTPIVRGNKTYGAALGLSEEERRLKLSAGLTALTDRHNQQLAELVDKLQREWSHVDIALFDANTLLADVLDHANYPAFDLDDGAQFDIAAQSQELRFGEDDSPQRFQQRCYRGGYLGESNPSFVCENSLRAIFWDVVHPTTYTHCWVSYGMHRQMHELGWTRPTPAIEEVGDWCSGISDVVSGHEELRVLRYVRKDEVLAPDESAQP